MEVLNFNIIKEFHKRYPTNKCPRAIKSSMAIHCTMGNMGRAEAQYLIDYYKLELTPKEKIVIR